MDGRKILKRIVNNWPVKVLSIVLAIVFYLFHRVGTLEERFLLIPLKIETTGKLIPMGNYNRMINVTIRGERNSIRPITEQDIEVYIDFGKFDGEGEYKVPIQFRKKGNAIGVTPLEIMVEPMEINVNLGLNP